MKKTIKPNSYETITNILRYRGNSSYDINVDINISDPAADYSEYEYDKNNTPYIITKDNEKDDMLQYGIELKPADFPELNDTDYSYCATGTGIVCFYGKEKQTIIYDIFAETENKPEPTLDSEPSINFSSLKTFIPPQQNPLNYFMISGTVDDSGSFSTKKNYIFSYGGKNYYRSDIKLNANDSFDSDYSFYYDESEEDKNKTFDSLTFERASNFIKIRCSKGFSSVDNVNVSEQYGKELEGDTIYCFRREITPNDFTLSDIKVNYSGDESVLLEVWT